MDWLPGAWRLDQLARRRPRAKALVIAVAGGQCAAQTLGDETGSSFRRVTTAIFALASLAYITDAPRGLLVKMRHRLVHDKVIRNALKRDI